MKRKPENQKTRRRFSVLFVACLSILFSLTQTTAAYQPFEFSTGKFSLENLANQNLFSPQSIFSVNTSGDTGDVLPGDGFCNDGAGNCSLRAAILEANALSGANIIDFNLAGGCGTITPGSALPDITDSVTIDGYSQPGALANTAATGSNAVLCVQLDGVIAGSNADGLRISAANTTIRGLAIGRFGDAGIEVNGNGGIVEGNFVGTDITGTAARANRLGIVVGANNVRVGGTTLLARNIVSANTRYGIALDQAGGSGTVQNNYVGLGSNSAALGNGESGISVFRSSGNIIGGATANARNVISGNGVTASGGLDGSGIYIFGDTLFNQSPNNTIQGNYVGTNPAGTGAIGNKQNGVKIQGAINATISGNVVSGNLIDGIGITGAGATGNVVKGNVIGLDATKNNSIGNTRDGASIFQVTANAIGGTTAGDGNWIAGNGQYGILISGAGGNVNTVQGNNVGFNVSNVAKPNLAGGITIFTSNNIIGGTSVNAKNYIAGNNGNGIATYFASGNSIQGNVLGLTPNNTALFSNIGIYVQDSANNIIGGTLAGAGNVVSGHQIGIQLVKYNANSPATGNQILGNFIGTNPAGTSAVPNTIGIGLLFADSNTIGGTTPEARNLISGNVQQGVYIDNSANNQVTGNYIGTKIDGATALGNGNHGVVLINTGSTGNVIGGTATGAGNLLSGNALSGVILTTSAANNRIEGNIIGLKADGSAALPNQTGVYFQSSANHNVIGGSAANAGNVISGNTQNGVLFDSGANTNRVEGNKIGSDAAGAIDLGNGWRGVEIVQTASASTSSNVIGGTTAAARNLISGNDGGGVRINGALTNLNTIAGNYIGAKADGIGYLSNGSYGVSVEAPNNTIGGATTAHRNVISGQVASLVPGVQITSQATGTLVQNNYIGTTADGSDYLFNGQGIYCTGNDFKFDSNLISGSFYGISVVNSTQGIITNNKLGTNAAATAFLGNGDAIVLASSSNIRVGDDYGTPAPNIIAGNGRSGILVVGGGAGNLISQNSIYDNAGLGIDLGNDGVTQNDNGDTDLANNYQNYPIINTVSTTITGSLNSTPNRQFRLEFYSSLTADTSGYGEGKTYLTNLTVTTNGSGNATFSVTNPQPLGSYVSATATDLMTNDTSEFSAWKQTLAPTAVNFNGARATAFDNGVLIEWQTGREAENLGFNVYRERGGKRELITPNLVAGSALTASENLLSEQNYSWFDANGDNTSSYSVEAVDTNGAKETYGAFESRTVAGKFTAANSTSLNQLGQSETTSTVTIDSNAKPNAKPSKEQTEIQNALAANKTVKLTVRRTGIYRVTAEQLFAGGLPEDVNAANLRLFADGIEQPINVTGADNGIFSANSAIEFYGAGTNTAETDARVYYLVASSNAGLRMSKTDLQAQPATANFYSATVERRDRTIYFSGLLNNDEENFFGAVVNNAGTNQIINAAQLAQNGGAAELEISLQGVTRNQHSVSVELNGSIVSNVTFTELERGTTQISLQSAQLRDGANTVRLVADNQSDVSLVDFVRLTYPHLYRAENNSLNLTASGGKEITVGNFTSKNIRVFDVTSPNASIELAAHVQKSASNRINRAEADSSEANSARNYSVKFTTTESGTRSLLAIADNQLAQAANVSLDNPSNLRDRRNAADLLIVTRREFFDSIAPLVRLRESQGLVVNLVDVSDIYDEFSFGRKSTAAINEFLNFAVTNWRKKPQFVLLAGDATYDPKGYLGNPNADVIQTKMVDTESIETASDEWLADFDGDGVGEMAIGRLPARTTNEVNAMVGKIVNYERQPVFNSATFVADLNDGGYDFAAANQSVISLLPQGVRVTDIRRENVDARTQLMNAIAGGQSIVSYSGHGSSNIWRGNLLTNADAVGMTNADRLPMFVMMTCLNGYFQDANADSLSEALLKNPRGGAVVVWASSGTTTPDLQTELNREFVRSLYEQNLTIGQAVRTAKIAVPNSTIRRTWTLLGDPTMRLK